jgi:hypothetical protein
MRGNGRQIRFADIFEEWDVLSPGQLKIGDLEIKNNNFFVLSREFDFLAKLFI